MYSNNRDYLETYIKFLLIRLLINSTDRNLYNAVIELINIVLETDYPYYGLLETPSTTDLITTKIDLTTLTIEELKLLCGLLNIN